MPTYNDTPLPTQRPSDSQSQIRDNFTQISNSYGTDHVPFTGSTQGYHKKVTFNDVASPSAPAGSQSVIYTTLVNAIPQLFFQNASQTVQITGTGASDFVTGSITGTGGGTYYLFSSPFGIKFFMGNVGTATGSQNYDLVGNSFGSIIYTAVASCFGSGGIGISITPSTNSTSFNVQRASSAPARFLVITN